MSNPALLLATLIPLAQTQGLALKLDFAMKPTQSITVYEAGVLRVAGRQGAPNEDQWSSKPPEFQRIPRQELGGRPAFWVSSDSLMTVERRGFEGTYRIWSTEGKLLHTIPTAEFESPIVFSRDHIIVGNRWLIKGKWVPFPHFGDQKHLRNRFGPNRDGFFVIAVSNWSDEAAESSFIRTWMEVGRGDSGWKRVNPPAAYQSLIPGEPQENGWVPVRLTNVNLNVSESYAMSGWQDFHRGDVAPLVPEGETRFWRNGTYAGATPPNLIVSNPERYQMAHHHFAVGKWGPLEIYQSMGVPVIEPDPETRLGRVELRFRLNGRWRAIREVMPFYRGKDADLRLIRESGGHLFFKDEGRNEVLIVKLPERWRR